MRVKRFVGKSMKEAVAQLKATFGDEAVILHTKRSRGGPFGLFGRPRVEIIAAVDVAPQPKPPPAPVNSSELQLLQQELQEVKGLLASQNKGTGPWQSLYEELIAGKSIRKRPVSLGQDDPDPSPAHRRRAIAALKGIAPKKSRWCPPGTYPQDVIVALVGPTRGGEDHHDRQNRCQLRFTRQATGKPANNGYLSNCRCPAAQDIC